jgi:hypothetical protein
MAYIMQYPTENGGVTIMCARVDIFSKIIPFIIHVS